MNVFRYILFGAIGLGMLFSGELLKAQHAFFHLLAMGPRFSITGVTSSNGQDSTVDSKLNYDTHAVVAWQAMTGASSYDVTIYGDDKTTVVCALQNTASTSYDFASCNLALGTYYRVHLQARQGVDTFFTENNWYRFYVNRQPTITSTGPWYILNTSGGCFDINALYSAPPGVGVASDADAGQTLTFVGTGSSTIGNTIANNSTYIRYTNTAKMGIDTFAVTITDGNGSNVAGTITIYNMSAYTWTGGAGSNTFETAGNWCGTINANKNGCAGSSTAPGSSNPVYINNLCTSAFCAPTTSSTSTYVFGVFLSANSLSVGNNLNFTTNYIDQTGGTFNGGNLTVTFQDPAGTTAIRVEKGTFNAPSDTMLINTTANRATHIPMFFYSPGIFNHNNGLVRINVAPTDQATAYTCSSSSGTNLCKSRIPLLNSGPLVFYNLEIGQSTDGYANSVSEIIAGTSTSPSNWTTAGGAVLVENNFNLGFGTPGITVPFISLRGGFELRGDYIIKADSINLPYGTQYEFGAVTLSGTGTQNISLLGGETPKGSVEVNKSSGSVILQTNFDVKQVNDFSWGNSEGNLNIISGTFDMNGYDLNVQGTITNGGTLQQGVNPACGNLTYGGYSGTAAICP